MADAETLQEILKAKTRNSNEAPPNRRRQAGDRLMELIASVRCSDRDLMVALTDGRTLTVPLWWYLRLLRATPARRERFEIGRFGVHWPEIDEDIELAGLLLGAKSPVRHSAQKENVTRVVCEVQTRDA